LKTLPIFRPRKRFIIPHPPNIAYFPRFSVIAGKYAPVRLNQVDGFGCNPAHVFCLRLPVNNSQSVYSGYCKIEIVKAFYVRRGNFHAIASQATCQMWFFSYQGGIPAPFFEIAAAVVCHKPFKRHIEQSGAFFYQKAVCGDRCVNTGIHQHLNRVFYSVP
jgi:hypothetical protein